MYEAKHFNSNPIQEEIELWIGRKMGERELSILSNVIRRIDKARNFVNGLDAYHEVMETMDMYFDYGLFDMDRLKKSNPKLYEAMVANEVLNKDLKQTPDNS